MMRLLIMLAEVRIPSGVFRERTTETIREVAGKAPEIFGLGLETIIGAATGGGAVGLGIGGIKLISMLMKHRKERKEGSPGRERADPFPRRLDEARQLRDMAHIVERRVPEYDAAVGRIVQEELQLRLHRADKAEKEILNEFWVGCRDRVDHLMPPSTKEYREAR